MPLDCAGRYRRVYDLVFAARRTHLPDINGNDSWTLPNPARYVVGTNGTVSYREINPGHRIRPEPHDIYPTLKRLNRDADPAKKRIRSLLQNRIALRIDPLRRLGGDMAPLAVGMIIGRGGHSGLAGVEP